MTPKQAIDLLDKVAATALLNRTDQLSTLQAVTLLRSIIDPAPAQTPPPEPPKLVETESKN